MSRIRSRAGGVGFRRAWGRRAVAALLWIAGSGASAAERAESADALASRVDEIERRLDGLDREYGERRGLIGVEEARSRFEDAVFDYLMGNYEKAALAFYALVEAEALPERVLDQDARWYLAECLFELENWSTALDVYASIAAEGRSHPFYADAVRRELEIYGILGDHDGFYEVYKREILSGRVPADDAVRYTVAKSFYRQGESARAKSMFSEIAPDSDWYGKARYFLGTILAEEGDYQAAIGEFQKVVDRGEADDPQVLELANLALGRLYYEVGDYEKATRYYQRIGASSDYFADQLYELVWTYVKQQEWDNALRHVEIFLIAFPDHAYTMQMKILQGHLYMKEKAFEQALVSYEDVVEDYTPLRDRLGELERSREDPAEFFRRIAEEGDASLSVEADRYQLPDYAVQMLVDDPEMARAVRAHRELERQRQDVDYASRLVGEVDNALVAQRGAIGTFNRARDAVRAAEDDALQARAALVGAEIELVQAHAPEGARGELRALHKRWDVVEGRVHEVEGEESARTDRYQTYLDQVREVQGQAARLRAEVGAVEAEAAAIRRVLNDRRGEIDPADQERVLAELDDVGRKLDRVSATLVRLESDTTRRRIMASIPREGPGEGGRQRGFILQDLSDIRRDLARYARGVEDPEARRRLAEYDALWKRLDRLADKADAVTAHLDASESREREQLRARLRDESRVLGGLDQDVENTRSEAEGLAVDITRSGFGKLEQDLQDTVMRADMGIVDVYWLRKTEVSDRITELSKERGLRIQSLDNRFEVIRQKLEE